MPHTIYTLFFLFDFILGQFCVFSLSLAIEGKINSDLHKIITRTSRLSASLWNHNKFLTKDHKHKHEIAEDMSGELRGQEAM
jgi:hypothetical protein